MGEGNHIARRGRDLRWALEFLHSLREIPAYPTAVDRLASGDGREQLPTHLTSLSAWQSFLDSLDFAVNSYWSANLLQAQTVQIRAAGEDYVRILFAHLAERQHPDTGLWEEQRNYASLNGLMKLALMYTAFGVPIPHAKEALVSSMEVAMSREEIVFCCQFYNPLITIHNLLTNMRANGHDAAANELNAILVERAPAFIRTTREKVRICKRDDGGFSTTRPAPPIVHKRPPSAWDCWEAM